MDIAGLIESFLTGTYEVTRRTAPAVAYKHGVARAPSTSTLTIRGCVQPASGRDLLRLPEGRRSNETRVLFTTTALVVGDEGQAGLADLVTVDGQSWECQHVESWVQDHSQGAGYRCILQRPSGGAE